MVDYQTTVFEVLRLIASSARAAFSMIEDRYGVIFERAQTVPIQFFTPRNSRDFKGTKLFPDRLHALMGDGDFLMGNTAVWTAAHYGIPCLMVVCNNRSFYNDERHQGRMAEQRGRPVENRWIGQRIDDPDIDIAGMARMQGAVGIGPVTDMSL